ncbi:MAG: HAD family hydrolase [Defluviimonas sp.]|uniref:HAD family hydrolase n=1 Tax=Albidovulum sp. TaxID=1872424 RepID=UPI002A25C68B|nr:HAD family hydrolase [Defluviimonas sp.]
MAPVDLVIFDCDGVLVDSEVLSADVMIAELGALGIVIDRAYVRQHFLGRSFPTVARMIRETHATPLPDHFEALYRRSLLQRFETELQPTQGIEAILADLRPRKCVATSSSRERVNRSLSISGLARFFGGDVFTASQVRNGKPAPDLFLFAADSMASTPDRTLVIEDSLPGIAAARAAGMRVLAYAGGKHCAGSPPATFDGAQVFDNWRGFPALLRAMSDGESL